MAEIHGNPRDARKAAEPTATLRVPLRPTNDAFITCVVCGRDGVEFEFFSRTPGTRQFQGIHRKCAETIGPVDKSGRGLADEK